MCWACWQLDLVIYSRNADFVGVKEWVLVTAKCDI